MQHTDKALAELLRLLEANSPEAMAWLMEVGYRQAYVTGWLFLGLAVVGIIAFVVGCIWLRNKWDSEVDDSEAAMCAALIVVSLFSACGFGYGALVRLANPGYFVYQMLKDLLPGQ